MLPTWASMGLSVLAVWRLACPPRTIQETTQKLQNAFQPSPGSHRVLLRQYSPGHAGQPCSVAKARILDARLSRRHLGPTTAPTRQARHRTALQPRSRAEGAPNPQPRLITHHSTPERDWLFWAHAFVTLPLLVMFFSHWELLRSLQSPVQMLPSPRSLLYSSPWSPHPAHPQHGCLFLWAPTQLLTPSIVPCPSALSYS